MLIGDVLDDVVVEHPGPQLVGRGIAGARQDRLTRPPDGIQVLRVDLQHPELPLHIKDSRLDARHRPQREVDDSLDRQRR